MLLPRPYLIGVQFYYPRKRCYPWDIPRQQYPRTCTYLPPRLHLKVYIPRRMGIGNPEPSMTRPAQQCRVVLHMERDYNIPRGRRSISTKDHFITIPARETQRFGVAEMSRWKREGIVGVLDRCLKTISESQKYLPRPRKKQPLELHRKHTKNPTGDGTRKTPIRAAVRVAGSRSRHDVRLSKELYITTKILQLTISRYVYQPRRQLRY